MNWSEEERSIRGELDEVLRKITQAQAELAQLQQVALELQGALKYIRSKAEEGGQDASGI